jgi:hypothetical protein
MKRYLLICTLLGLCSFAWAQNASLVMQGENIKGLTLTLDGRVVNEQPSPSVRLDNLQEGFHKVSITAIANNGAIAGDVRDIILENGFTMIFGIGIANNGKVALRLLDKTDLQATTTTTTTTTNTTSGSNSVGIGTNLGVTVTDPATGLPIQMGVNVNATTNGQQTNVDINGLPIQVNVGVPTTQTTTTTTVTTTNPAIGQPTPTPAYDPAPTPAPTSAPAPTATTCIYAMDDIAFQTAANAVNAEGFSQTKLKIMKQAFNKKCLNVNQVKALMALFNFENDKLDVAKYCYTRCTNRDDYFLVNESFSFSSSKEELDTFIQGQNGTTPQD